MVHLWLIRIDAEKCVHCYTCLINCPTDALHIEDDKLCYNKDFCSYDKKCQDKCPRGALKIIDW